MWQSATKKKTTKPPGCPFSSIPLKNSKLHPSWSLRHSTLACMATTSSLQNINWLSKEVWAVYIKEKMSFVPVYIPSPCNVFLYFFEGKLHKDSKLGIMTNVGKNRLVKVIFTNIQKISDACANSFGRYIMI